MVNFLYHFYPTFMIIVSTITSSSFNFRFRHSILSSRGELCFFGLSAKLNTTYVSNVLFSSSYIFHPCNVENSQYQLHIILNPPMHVYRSRFWPILEKQLDKELRSILLPLRDTIDMWLVLIFSYHHVRRLIIKLKTLWIFIRLINIYLMNISIYICKRSICSL